MTHKGFMKFIQTVTDPNERIRFAEQWLEASFRKSIRASRKELDKQMAYSADYRNIIQEAKAEMT